MIWKNGQKIWSKVRSSVSPTQETQTEATDKVGAHLDKAKASVKALLEDTRLPDSAKAHLAEEYRQLKRLLHKLENEDVHIAVFGRVSVGKSALLNALAGKKVFETDVLHGKTTHSAEVLWHSYDTGGVYLIDTPGIDEIDGQTRAKIARDVVAQADVVLFVLDGDMSDIEYDALREVYRPMQPMIVVVNKADRYTKEALSHLLVHLRQKLCDFVVADCIVSAAASPARYREIMVSETGEEEERLVVPEVEIAALRTLLWQLVKERGKTYAALNAGVFADALSERVGQEIVRAKREVAERIIQQYALIKAVGVAINPIPAIDLLALAADGSMVVHLSNIYGIALTRHKARELIQTIVMQAGILMGTVYGVQLFSSTLKALSGGLSTLITAGAQGGVAYYGSYVIGRAAEQYFAQGASWGEQGAKHVIAEIIQDIDKDKMIKDAQQAIWQLLGKKS